MTTNIVETADDLEPIPARDREAVATLLSEGAPGVIHMQSWLSGEKSLTAAENHPQVYVGEIENYSEKAFQVNQPELGNSDYVPKSASEAFVLAEGVDTVETPQSGLADFER